MAFTFIAIIQFFISPIGWGPGCPRVILLAHVGGILVFGFAAFLAPEAFALSLLSQVLQLLGL